MDTDTDPEVLDPRPLATEAQAKALASPLRLRILRSCLHEPHTNREIAEVLDLNPATALHHVRTLVDTGFLAAQPARTGRRGAREVPYLATRLSWRLRDPGASPPMLAAFLADVDGLPPDSLDLTRLGVKLPSRQIELFRSRLADLVQELADLPSDPDGDAWSVFIAVHPDRSVPRADPAPERPRGSKSGASAVET